VNPRVVELIAARDVMSFGAIGARWPDLQAPAGWRLGATPPRLDSFDAVSWCLTRDVILLTDKIARVVRPACTNGSTDDQRPVCQVIFSVPHNDALHKSDIGPTRHLPCLPSCYPPSDPRAPSLLSRAARSVASLGAITAYRRVRRAMAAAAPRCGRARPRARWTPAGWPPATAFAASVSLILIPLFRYA